MDLGAGLNSFAWRRPDLMAGLALFEVDHPATQEWKRGRLAATGLACPPNLHFAGVDFRAADTLGERLTGRGFDPARASIWSWLGVIQYLPLAAVVSMLRAVAGLAAPGSRLVASYGVPDELMEPASAEFTELTRAFTARIGEPQITWVAPGGIEAVARAAGWPRVRSVDPSSFAPWFAGRTDGLEPVRAEWLLVATDARRSAHGRFRIGQRARRRPGSGHPAGGAVGHSACRQARPVRRHEHLPAGGGKVAEQWEHWEQWDKLEVLQQLGVLAAPGHRTAKD